MQYLVLERLEFATLILVEELGYMSSISLWGVEITRMYELSRTVIIKSMQYLVSERLEFITPIVVERLGYVSSIVIIELGCMNFIVLKIPRYMRYLLSERPEFVTAIVVKGLGYVSSIYIDLRCGKSQSRLEFSETDN